MPTPRFLRQQFAGLCARPSILESAGRAPRPAACGGSERRWRLVRSAPQSGSDSTEKTLAGVADFVAPLAAFFLSRSGGEWRSHSTNGGRAAAKEGLPVDTAFESGYPK
jgi:hypothetical protein